MEHKDYYMPAVLIAAGIAGVIGATPCLNIVNCCFCLPAILGAMFAVRAIALKSGTPVAVGEGALVGLIVGAAAGVLAGAGSALASGIGQQFIATSPIMQDPQFAQFRQLQANQSWVGTFCCWFIGYGLFGPIGGMLGSAFFKPPAPPAQMGGYGAPPAY